MSWRSTRFRRPTNTRSPSSRGLSLRSPATTFCRFWAPALLGSLFETPHPVSFPEMKDAQKKAVRAHRRQQKAKGLVRVEVQAPATDAALLREVAAELRSGSRRSARVRSLLRRSLRPEKSLFELLALDLPDEVVDRALARSKDRGREIKL